MTGTWLQTKGIKEGSAPARERRQTQACGAGHRDEQRRLVGGGWRAMTRWAALRTGRGVGGQVKQEGFDE